MKKAQKQESLHWGHRVTWLYSCYCDWWSFPSCILLRETFSEGTKTKFNPKPNTETSIFDILYKWKRHRNKNHCTAQCVLCKVRRRCIFYNAVSDTIRRRGGYSGIFWEEGVAVDTGAHFRGNHGSRVWKSQKCDKMYFPHTRTSWDKYMFIVIPKLKFQDRSELFGCAENYTEQSRHCAL